MSTDLTQRAFSLYAPLPITAIDSYAEQAGDDPHELLLKLYYHTLPTFTATEAIIGYPVISNDTASYILRKFANISDRLRDPQASLALLWMNRGFSSPGARSGVPHLKSMPDFTFSLSGCRAEVLLKNNRSDTIVAYPATWDGVMNNCHGTTTPAPKADSCFFPITEPAPAGKLLVRGPYTTSNDMMNPDAGVYYIDGIDLAKVNIGVFKDMVFVAAEAI